MPSRLMSKPIATELGLVLPTPLNSQSVAQLVTDASLVLKLPIPRVVTHLLLRRTSTKR